ncbi:hypothetical protein DAETH_48930 (plasmid) [Deinococcus aetherius]|uniref:HTH merR-type domain-containing protein n=1 Tax=Deinococcus aetherius TaxID=200252 RepID=A0ABM8AM37_9DEIO|nr:hypothetical protein DAETH_48930 [Deinococcus aetherius]
MLGVQPRTVRRMAETYESVFGELPRVRPEEDRSPRLWTAEAVRRVQVAHLALKSGKVSSLEHALVLVRDGAELPVVAASESGQEAATLSAQIAQLKTLLEAQGRELASLRELVQAQTRELPEVDPPAPEGEDDLRHAIREEVQAALNPERLRVALHASTPAPQRPSGWRRVLAALVVGRSRG